MRRSPLLVLLAAGLAGCGVGGGGPVSTGEEWLGAVADEDAAAACELMAPSAVQSIGRFVDLPRETPCTRMMEAYAAAFDGKKLAAIQKVGLVRADAVEGGRVGVFPESGVHQFEVLLTQKVDGDWRLVSVAIPPTGVGGRG